MIHDNDLFEDQGYSLDRRLAADSWGTLYTGFYVPHKRPVLLRHLAAELAGADAWDLAAAEIRAWARVDSPGVLQPLDWGVGRAGAFVVTERAAGRLLAELVTEDEGLTGFDPGSVFKMMVMAVDAACQCGVLHLGLGLTNVWVSGSSVSVSEFGFWYVRSEFDLPVVEPPVADPPASDRPASDPPASDRPAFDRPASDLSVSDLPTWVEDIFAAPEQGTGGRAVAATDVYSLGLMYVAMCFGLDSARAVADGRPEGSDLLTRLPAELSKCLEKQPLSRHRSVSDLAASLGYVPATAVESWRDCPMCRLKAEIARDMAAKEGSLTARARRFFQEAPAGGMPAGGKPVGREDRPQPGSAMDLPFEALLARIVPWVAIATLTIATLIVWWLAFK